MGIIFQEQSYLSLRRIQPFETGSKLDIIYINHGEELSLFGELEAKIKREKVTTHT